MTAIEKQTQLDQAVRLIFQGEKQHDIFKKTGMAHGNLSDLVQKYWICVKYGAIPNPKRPAKEGRSLIYCGLTQRGIEHLMRNER